MEITKVAHDKIQTEKEYLSRISAVVFENRMSMALWRLPDDDTRHLIISENHQLKPAETPLEDLSPGFIFAPFDAEKERIFLKSDFYFVFKDNKLQRSEPIHEKSYEWFSQQSAVASRKIARAGTPIVNPQEHDKAHFIGNVQSALQAIGENVFEKVVPSRVKKIDLPEDFDVVNAFQKLCVAFPNTLVSLVHIPDIGTWLGASPEILVSVENGSLFKTVALAGTKPFHNETNLKSVTWTQKEIEEQALVERYIISCFKKIRLREYDEHGPKTVVAGNLLHLKSDFTVDMKATNFPQLGSVMLNLLHPTSAVCGMPLAPAKEFLKKQEGYDRTFYAGYLGPVNIDNNTHIFVNLRCLQLMDGYALLYAGAGVTADSVPESEWEETEIKLNTLTAVLF